MGLRVLGRLAGVFMIESAFEQQVGGQSGCIVEVADRLDVSQELLGGETGHGCFMSGFQPLIAERLELLVQRVRGGASPAGR